VAAVLRITVVLSFTETMVVPGATPGIETVMPALSPAVERTVSVVLLVVVPVMDRPSALGSAAYRVTGDALVPDAFALRVICVVLSTEAIVVPKAIFGPVTCMVGSSPTVVEPPLKVTVALFKVVVALVATTGGVIWIGRAATSKDCKVFTPLPVTGALIANWPAGRPNWPPGRSTMRASAGMFGPTTRMPKSRPAVLGTSLITMLPPVVVAPSTRVGTSLAALAASTRPVPAAKGSTFRVIFWST